MRHAGDLAPPGTAHEGVVYFNQLAGKQAGAIDASQSHLLEGLAGVNFGSTSGPAHLISGEEGVCNVVAPKRTIAALAENFARTQNLRRRPRETCLYREGIKPGDGLLR